MYTALFLLFAGTLIGYIIRNKKKLIAVSEKMLTVSIYTLLLVLGVSVGANREIVSNIETIGLKALLLTIGAVLGSISLSLLLYRCCFTDKNEK